MVSNTGIISNATSQIVTSNGKDYKTTTYTFSAIPIVNNPPLITDVAHPVTSFKIGDFVSVSNMKPESLNISSRVISSSNNSFTVVSGITDSMDSTWTNPYKGRFTKGSDYDVSVTPTGRITNVNRGMFGTNVSNHNLIDDLASKNLTASLVDVKVVSAYQMLLATAILYPTHTIILIIQT
jgi:hypothetical protein